MKNDQIWNYYKIRNRADKLLNMIEARDKDQDSDMAGGGCPSMVSVLFILERIADDRFFGSIDITCKGPRTMKPCVAKQTFKMDEAYKDLLT